MAAPTAGNPSGAFERAQGVAVMTIGAAAQPIPDVGTQRQERQKGREEDGDGERFQGNRLTPADYHAARCIQSASLLSVLRGLQDFPTFGYKQPP